MQIQTERLIIRHFAVKDIGPFTEYRNNPDWMRFQGFKGLDRDAYEAQLLRVPEPEEGMQLAVALAETDGLIGDIYLKKFGDVYWLGYTIHPGYARQGYAAEAARGVVGWAKESGAAKILAGVLPGNTASIRLLEKLGFHYLGEEEGERVYCLRL